MVEAVSKTGHREGCDCKMCRAIKKQLDKPMTTKSNRIEFKVHLTKDEASKLQAMGDRLGISRKAIAEKLIRSAL